MQIIFEDDDDKRHFIKKLKQCLAEEKATEEEASLIAWCIMINHIHMLTKMDIEVLTRIMKRLLISYAKYFNARYDRVGPLFQGRFDNVAIESESQLLATVRYIHRNPLAIPGQTMESYPWSSYHEYLEAPIICDTEFVKSLFSSHDEFISFHKSWDIPEDAKQLPPSKRSLPDEEVIAYIKDLYGENAIIDTATLDKPIRNARLAHLKSVGAKGNQLARIFGIGRCIAQRA